MKDARPHDRRFPRTEQEIVWAAIHALDIADRLVVLRELATEVWTQDTHAELITEGHHAECPEGAFGGG